MINILEHIQVNAKQYLGLERKSCHVLNISVAKNVRRFVLILVCVSSVRGNV